MQIVRLFVPALYILAFSISARLLSTSSWISLSNFIREPRFVRLQFPSKLLDLPYRFHFLYHSDMQGSTIPTKRPSASTHKPNKPFKLDAAANNRSFTK